MNVKCYFGRHIWTTTSATPLLGTDKRRLVDQCDRCGVRRGRIEATR